MMNYTQAREYITALSARGIKPGLDTIRELCGRLGDPQDKIKTIHIAGTNGKGSVGAFIESILRASGMSIGRYVSPAVEEYREIIQLDGEYIEEAEYADIVSRISAVSHGISPTAFEAETAAAFLYFAEKGCDYAIIECGMGGELDATNIIKSPAASVITSISLDHTAFLGDTIYEIAKNKAGIIKEGTQNFSARQPDEAMKALYEKTSHIITAHEPKIIRSDMLGTHFNYKGHNSLFISLVGTHQPHNAALAIEVCDALGIDDETIRNGLKDTQWKFRFETDENGWIFDGAHNPDAAKRLRETIDTLLKGKKLAFITGVFRDKDYKTITALTAGAANVIYTVKPPGERGLESAVLAETARQYCSNVTDAKTIENAVRLCAEGGYDNVIVFGSLSFLSRIKQEKEALYEQMSENT